MPSTKTPEILRRHASDVLSEWLEKQVASLGMRGKAGEDRIREESRQFLALLTRTMQNGVDDIRSPPWQDVRDFLANLSRSKAREGYTPSETASFIFALKQPLFSRLRDELGRDPEALAQETWATSELIDELGLYTTEVYQQGREELIARQGKEMLELSTPVVELWEGILAVPLIGTLDSARTQVVMETLLEKVVEKGALIAIIDITGVPTVDTLVAQHLLKTVSATKLMGADCIISGIRPQIAQTIVHLGVELGDVSTRSSLADAFALALRKIGRTISDSSRQ